MWLLNRGDRMDRFDCMYNIIFLYFRYVQISEMNGLTAIFLSGTIWNILDLSNRWISLSKIWNWLLQTKLEHWVIYLNGSKMVTYRKIHNLLNIYLCSSCSFNRNSSTLVNYHMKLCIYHFGCLIGQFWSC